MHALLLLLAAVPDAGSSFTITGRVVDEKGVRYSNVEFTLWDSTRHSFTHEQREEQLVWTGDGGTFAVTLPFQPNELTYECCLPEWVEPLSKRISVKPGEDVVFNVRTIPHEEVRGRVVDDTGAPVHGAHITGVSSLDTDENGAFSFETKSPASGTLRVRRMGFEPVVADFSALNPVRLENRRALITVTVVDEKTWMPVREDLVVITAFKAGERLSFCTAGIVEQTHEPYDGICTLDASPGDVELRVNGETNWVRVSDLSPQSVTLMVTLPPRPVFPRGVDLRKFE